jgi:methionine biosynthesis protein MetW
MGAKMTSEDTHAHSLSLSPVDPLRYAYSGIDRGEVTDRLLSVIAHRSRVLDVGCGTGSVSQILRDRLDLDLIGLEPNAERAAVARGRGIDVRTEPLTPAILQDLGKFDVILFGDVLEHLLDPAETLGIARQGLKPGGSVIASVPNVAHWTIRSNLLRGRFDYESSGLMDATHLRWFTKASLERLFARVGIPQRSYTATAGSTQPFYTSRLAWRLLGAGPCSSIVIWLATHWPEMFGFQHIVVASPTSATEPSTPQTENGK